MITLPMNATVMIDATAGTVRFVGRTDWSTDTSAQLPTTATGYAERCPVPHSRPPPVVFGPGGPDPASPLRGGCPHERLRRSIGRSQSSRTWTFETGAPMSTGTATPATSTGSVARTDRGGVGKWSWWRLVCRRSGRDAPYPD